MSIAAKLEECRHIMSTTGKKSGSYLVQWKQFGTKKGGHTSHSHIIIAFGILNQCAAWTSPLTTHKQSLPEKYYLGRPWTYCSTVFDTVPGPYVSQREMHIPHGKERWDKNGIPDWPSSLPFEPSQLLQARRFRYRGGGNRKVVTLKKCKHVRS